MGSLADSSGARRLADFASPDLVGTRWRLLLPIGSTEQHGPHLPLDTDTRIAVAVAERACERADRVLVAPAISIGAAGEHAGFAGTLSVGTEVLTNMVVEIVRTAGTEFGSVTVVSGHGGNAEALRAARQLCHDEGRPLEVWWPRHQGGDAHAGFTETSVMMTIAPDRVDTARLEVGVTTAVGELAVALRAKGVRAVSENGVLGDPRGANAVDGAEILSGWVEEVVELLQR